MKGENTNRPEPADEGTTLAMRIVSDAVARSLCEVDRAADEIGLPLDDVMNYCNLGLVETFSVEKQETLYVDEEGLYSLRQIKHLVEIEGVNRKGAQIIVHLLKQVQKMDNELRFLRER